MADYSDIIERLEKATGPDRELDCQIAATVEPHRFDSPGFPESRPIPPFTLIDGGGCIRFEGGGIMDTRFFPRVTASLDAAIALVEARLPGAEFELTTIYNIAQARLPLNGPHEFHGRSEVGSLPIAMLIAMFRALQSAEPKP